MAVILDLSIFNFAIIVATKLFILACISVTTCETEYLFMCLLIMLFVQILCLFFLKLFA